MRLTGSSGLRAFAQLPILLAAGVCLPAVGHADDDDEAFLNQIEKRLVVIEPVVGDAPRGCGVGMFLNKQYILTARHVVKPPNLEAEPKSWHLRQNDEHVVVVEQLDTSARGVADVWIAPGSWDLAILKLPPDLFPLQGKEIDSIARLNGSDMQGWHASIIQTPPALAGCLERQGGPKPVGNRHPTVLKSPVPVKTAEYQSASRMRILEQLVDGHSGSPVVSRTFRRVVGVYTEGRHGETPGYAVSLDEPAVVEFIHKVTGTLIQPVFFDPRRKPEKRDSWSIIGSAAFPIRTEPMAPRVVVGAGYDQELHTFPLYAPIQSIGLRLGAGALGGITRSSYLPPRPEQAGPAVETSKGKELGVWISAALVYSRWRLASIFPSAGLGVRAATNYQLGSGDPEVELMLTVPLALHLRAWSILLEPAFALSQRAGYRYPGFGASAQKQDGAREFWLSIGPVLGF